MWIYGIQQWSTTLLAFIKSKLFNDFKTSSVSEGIQKFIENYKARISLHSNQLAIRGIDNVKENSRLKRFKHTD